MEPFRISGAADKGKRTSLPIIIMIPLLIAMFLLMLWLMMRTIWSWDFALFLIVSIFILALFEAVFLRRFLTARRTKTFEIDDRGVRFLDGERTVWSHPWNEIIAVRNTFPGSHSFTGIIIRTKDKSFRVDNTEHIGPRIKLVEAYRVLSEEAKRRNIRVLDLRGWSATQLDREDREKGMAAFEKLKGQWFFNPSPGGLLGGSLKVGVPVALAGIASIVIMARITTAAYSCVLGGMITFIGLFVIFLGYITKRDTISAIKFDDEALTVRPSTSKEVAIPWADILQIRTNPESTYIGVLPRGMFGWDGNFTAEASLAVKARYIEEFEKHYDILDGHNVFQDRVEVTFADGRREIFLWKNVVSVSARDADPFILEARGQPILRLSPLDRDIALEISTAYNKYLTAGATASAPYPKK
jgi:hypothetical protein